MPGLFKNLQSIRYTNMAYLRVFYFFFFLGLVYGNYLVSKFGVSQLLQNVGKYLSLKKIV